MLYGVDQQLIDAGATPVLVEGPLDALAVTSAGRGRYLGVAPLGTSLTQTQARLLATLHPEPIVATDADPAGRAAAERAYWLLTQHAVSPRSVALPEGNDPADILHRCGPEALAASIDGAHPLAQDLIDARLAHASGHPSIKDLATVIAADAPSRWLSHAHDLTERTDTKPAQMLADLAEATTHVEPSTIPDRTTTTLSDQRPHHMGTGPWRPTEPGPNSRPPQQPGPAPGKGPRRGMRRVARDPTGPQRNAAAGTRPRPGGPPSNADIQPASAPGACMHRS